MEGYQKPIRNPYEKKPATQQVTSVPKTAADASPRKDETGTEYKRLVVSDSVEVEDKATVKLAPATPKEEIPQVVPEKPEIDDPTLKAVVEAAAEVAEKNEDISALRAQQEKEYADRSATELIPEDAVSNADAPAGTHAVEQTFETDPTGKPLFYNGQSVAAADVDIFSTDDLDQMSDTAIRKSFMETTAKIHQISDTAAMNIVDVMIAYKHNKDINVYGLLNDEAKGMVKSICVQTGAPLSAANTVAKMMIQEMIRETANDQAFIDIERSIAQISKIPSITDMYSEHVDETMNEKLPKMAAAIQDEDPEKAKLLLTICDRYNWSRDLTFAREFYDKSKDMRKMLRRMNCSARSAAIALNTMNKDSKFRMTDGMTIKPILMKVIVNDSDGDITEEELDKFLVLIFRSANTLNPDDLLDASYMYYLLKNISMLSYINPDSTNPEAFSAELMSNIKSLIYYIRVREAEYESKSSDGGDGKCGKRRRKRK